MMINSKTLKIISIIISFCSITSCSTKQEECEEFFYEDGKVKEINCDKEELKLKQSVLYYRSGRIPEIGFLKNDLRHNKWDGWFRNGYQAYNGFYSNGKPDSLWVFYYKNGCRSSYGLLKDGYMTGKWVNFHIDGDSTIRTEDKSIQQIIPIDLKYPVPIQSSQLSCEKIPAGSTSD